MIPVFFSFQGKHAEANESTAIRTMSLANLHQLPESALWEDMAPSSKGCILIYLRGKSNLSVTNFFSEEFWRELCNFLTFVELHNLVPVYGFRLEIIASLMQAVIRIKIFLYSYLYITEFAKFVMQRCWILRNDDLDEIYFDRT